VREYVGGYDDWQRQRQIEEEKPAEPDKSRKQAVLQPEDPISPNLPRKLTYKEQRVLEAQKRELAEMPKRIESLENAQHQLMVAMNDPLFYQRDSAEIARDAARLKELEDQLAQAFERWEELEGL
jgi:ATP-binding cassette subfamily F protein uup